jgi:hypothetical protein
MMFVAKHLDVLSCLLPPLFFPWRVRAHLGF